MDTLPCIAYCEVGMPRGISVFYGAQCQMIPVIFDCITGDYMHKTSIYFHEPNGQQSGLGLRKCQTQVATLFESMTCLVNTDSPKYVYKKFS